MNYPNVLVLNQEEVSEILLVLDVVNTQIGDLVDGFQENELMESLDTTRGRIINLQKKIQEALEES